MIWGSSSYLHLDEGILGQIQVVLGSLEQFDLCSRNGSDFRRVRVNLDEFELSLVHGSDFGEV